MKKLLAKILSVSLILSLLLNTSGVAAQKNQSLLSESEENSEAIVRQVSDWEISKLTRDEINTFSSANTDDMTFSEASEDVTPFELEARIIDSWTIEEFEASSSKLYSQSVIQQEEIIVDEITDDIENSSIDDLKDDMEDKGNDANLEDDAEDSIVDDASIYDSGNTVLEPEDELTADIEDEADISEEEFSVMAVDADLVPVDLRNVQAEPLPYDGSTFVFYLYNYGGVCRNPTFAVYRADTVYLGTLGLNMEIKADSVYLIEFELARLPEGTHKITIDVNPNKAITESNYNNNKTSRSFRFAGPSGVGWDMSVVDVIIPKDSQKFVSTVEQPILVEVTVANLGSGTSPITNLSFIASKSANEYFTALRVPAMDPMHGATATFEVEFVREDTFLVGARANYPQVSGDTNSTNDTLVKAVQIINPHYVLDEQYTDYFQKPGSYSGHQGWDLDAPTGANIYSMFEGKARLSTYHKDTGYYIVVQHDNTLKSTTLNSRYLHMDYPAYVNTGLRVYHGEIIGAVGSSGYSLDPNNPVPHLHLEVWYGTNDKAQNFNCISVEEIWPNVSFRNLYGRAAGFSSPADTVDLTDFNDIEEIRAGRSIDTRIILHIGVDEFHNWLETTDNVNLKNLIQDFNLTLEDIQEITESDEYYYQYLNLEELFA